MSRIKFLIYCMILLLMFGTANALNIIAEFSGGIYNEVGTDYINPNVPFTITVSAENTDIDPVRLGWSSPFRFYGTDQVTTLAGPGNVLSDPAFDAVWNMGVFNAVESWDGDLTTGNLAGPGEYYNYSGISMAGWNPASGIMVALTFEFEISQTVTDPSVIFGNFCIAQGDFDNATFDWLFEDPVPVFDEICIPVKQYVVNLEITNCPAVDLNIQHHEQVIYDFELTEAGEDPVTFSVESGPGSIDPATGVYTWAPDCGDVGSHEVTVVATDGVSTTPPCVFYITVLNTAPVVEGDCNQTFLLNINSSKDAVASFTATDPNGGLLTFTASTTEPSLTVTMDGGDVNVTTGGVLGTFPITVCVTDCNGVEDCCDIQIEVSDFLPYEIVIEKVHGQLQGHHSYVDVIKMVGAEDILAFDFLLGYDPSALTLTGAIPGELFSIPGDFEWEYFTYRYSWNGNCGNGCPSGLVRVVALAETNNGGHHPYSVTVPDGTVLFSLDFLVSNDRTFECMYIPVHFYWMDCGDNTIAFHDATSPPLDVQTAVSQGVFWYNGNAGFPYFEVTNPTFGFPTYMGVQDECFIPDGDKPLPVPFIHFFGGGIDIICADSIDARGDVNLNGLANEIADAVVLTNYFIYGLASFTVNVEGQIAATEINGDGMPLTIADLVYLIRIIVGDALPIPKVAPNITADIFTDGQSIKTDAEIGAAHIVLNGNADVELGQDAFGMEFKSYFDGTVTNVLLYSFEKDITASGELLRTNSELVKIDMVDYNANSYKISMKPVEFVLTQNYPNPFNPLTVVELMLPVASDYSFAIFNIAGQKVFDQNGFSEAGTVTFNVDLSNHASGVYFYKVEAGQFSATKKMILLK